MSWNRDFLGALSSSSISLEWALQFVNVANHLGQEYTIYSNRGQPQIDTSGISIAGSRVIPQRWNVSFGGFSVQIVGDLRKCLPYIRKGQIAALYCRIIGSTDFERIAIGQLDTLSGFRGRFQMNFRDLLSALQNSLDTRAGTAFSTSDPPRFNLFYEVGQSVNITHTLATSHTTLQVSSNTVFKKHSGTASIPSRGMIKITPTSGDEYFVFWTGTSGSTDITGISNVTNRGGSRASATTGVGSTATYIAFAENQPWDILGSIITSTGTAAANGPLDIFPREWSVGGYISNDLFDFADTSKQASYIKRSDNGVYEWGLAIESPLTNGIRSIVDIGILSGQWPVFRQGKISWRGCSDPDEVDSEISGGAPVAQIGDQDIIEILSHDFYNPDITNIYRTTRIVYNQAGSGKFSGGVYDGDRVDTLPALATIRRDNNLYYLHDRGGVDNSETMALGDLRRMRRWDLYISERLVLRVSLKLAGLVAGDVVEISSRYLYGLLEPQNRTFRGKRAMVTACDFDFDNQRCSLTLCIPSRKTKQTTDTEV